MSLQIAACSILYNPPPSVKHNILSYINVVQKIYLFDNSDSKISDSTLFAFESKVIIINNWSNEGIAKNLNVACELAIKDGFEFLLLMDQDSFFDEASINEYFKCIEAFTENKKEVSAFGINHETKSIESNCNYNKVKHLITSGSIINLNNYKNIGHFDENLFIDFVDTDYCFKSILKGYELIEIKNIFMNHQIGTIIEKRSIKNFKLSNRSIHSGVRLYYMLRNFLY